YLADKCDPDGPITANLIGKIEQGVNTWPRGPRREAFKAVLGVQTNSEIGLRNRRRRARFSGRDAATSSSFVDDLAANVGDATNWYRDLSDAVAVLIQMCAHDLSRRSFLRAAPLVGAALVSVERDWLLSLVNQTVEQTTDDGVSPAVAATYKMIEMLDEMDNRFGGGHARLAGVSYLSETVLPRLAQTPDGPERTALLTAAAQLTSNTGWMSYDCGGFGLGQMYMTQAVRLCAETGEKVLAGQIFAGLSHLAVAAGKPAEALNLAEVGLATAAHASSPLGTMRLHAMRARAHAALQDRTKAARALHDAEKAIDSNGGQDDTTRCVRHLDHAYLTAEMAHCFSAVGDYENAERHAQLAAKRTAGRGRRRALSLTVLATARIEGQGRDLEGALDAATQALDQMRQVSSGRSVAAVRAFQQRLTPYRDEPAVQRFNAEASTVITAANSLNDLVRDQ
ncbi:hypothetical protein, partial [Phytohabitans aurantiacus]|uniref:hypothetical protein n=1 Tax=Phytohabitans aurantiacus TaxID=3016789 RepID=UPI00249254FA